MFIRILRKPTTLITIKEEKVEEIQESKPEVKIPKPMVQKTFKYMVSESWLKLILKLFQL